MLNLLSIKAISGIIVSVLVGIFVYFVNDYIKVKGAYRISQKTIKILEHRRTVLDKIMLKVEKKQNEIFDKQNKALLEMDRKGYITSGDGSNPIWMRYESEDDD